MKREPESSSGRRRGLPLRGRGTLQIARAVAFVAASLLSPPATAQVTANILTRVFPIKVGEDTGSSFTLEVEGRQYLITARHIVFGLSDGDSIELLRENRWTPFKVRRLNVEPLAADAAVLVLPTVLEQTLQIKAAYDGLTLAESLYFLGFPYGLSMPRALQPSGFPIPFVKHGICSAFGRAADKVTYVWLDGHNNPGFSGGPIVRQPPGGATPTIVGVVSAFWGVDEPILRQRQKTDLTYKANTGIVIGVAITHVLEAIAARPIGVPVAHPS